MPLAQFPARPTTARTEIQQPRRLRVRSIAGTAALLIGLIGSGGGVAAASVAATPQAPAPAPAPAPFQAAAPAAPEAGDPGFGPNVRIFDPSMPVAEIQATVDSIAAAQVDDEMGSNRYSLLFKPGTYGSAEEPLIVQVGYSTEVAGLGASPTDVTINGHVDVYNRCLTADNCIALNNFWRSLSNLTINVTGLDGCRGTANFWAASQASPMRRVNVTGGNLSLMDYCTAGPQFASGGFISDSKTGDVINGSQQQYFVRDSSIGEWSNGVWNQVFSGVEGAPAQSFPNPPYTNLASTPVSREKPYLTLDAAGQYNVFVPAVRQDSAGTTWENGPTAGRSIPLSDFYVASPADSVKTINSQLARGKNLLLTPGVYDVDQSIEVKRANTVVLGLGMATLTAVNGAVPLTVADVPGVDIAAVTVDAGEVNSPALMRIGKPTNPGAGGSANSLNHSDPADPDHAPRRVLPHRRPARRQGLCQSRGQQRQRAPGRHLGLACRSRQRRRLDHQHRGQRRHRQRRRRHGHGAVRRALPAVQRHLERRTRQDRLLPERTALRRARTRPPGSMTAVLGWAGYKIADSVTTHELWGGGSYVYNNVDPTIHATRGFEVPVTPGVKLHDLLTVNLGAGTLDHVVNDTGAPVSTDAVGVPSYVASFG